MIGIVVVTHGKIGEEMVRAVGSIVPEGMPMRGVSLEHGEEVPGMRKRIGIAIAEVDRGNGVLLLADLFGGTPANLCLSFLQEGRVEVVTGVNLPMLIKLKSLKGPQSLSDTAEFIREYGQKNITRAADILARGAA